MKIQSIVKDPCDRCGKPRGFITYISRGEYYMICEECRLIELGLLPKERLAA